MLFPSRSVTLNQGNNLSLKFLDDTPLVQVDEFKHMTWLTTLLQVAH